MKENVIFSGITVVTLNKENQVFKDAYVTVEQGKITYIGQDKPETKGFRIIEGKNKVLMPGLINSHTHIPMSMLRGYSDDKELQAWLTEDIFPTEDKFTSESVKASTRLGLMEAISFGTTSISDMYFFCDDIAKVCAESKIKANISRGTTVFTEDFDAKTYLPVIEQRELFNKWNEYDNGLIKIDMSIHGEYTSNYKLWETIATMAYDFKTRIHVHISETKLEHEQCIKRYNLTPTQVLSKYGVFNNKVLVAHGVYLTEEDMDIIKKSNSSVALNPVSNLKLASGVADGMNMFNKGINLCIGTDGMASNNNADLFEEIKLTAILQKEKAKDPKCFSALDVLNMATKGGAIAQGREKETGEIAVGLDADLIMIDFDKPHLYPCHNVVSNIVYCAKGSDVSMTMVRGEILYENGDFKTLDKEKIIYEIEKIHIPRIFN